MHPILVEPPAKVLFWAALLVTCALAGRFIRKRPISLSRGLPAVAALVCAAALLRAYGGAWWPTRAALDAPWPVATVSTFTAALALALVAGWALVRRLGRVDFASEQLDALCVVAAAGGLVGARTLGAAVDLLAAARSAAAGPTDVVGAWASSGVTDVVGAGASAGLADVVGAWASAGLVSVGGWVGGALATGAYCRARRLSFLRWADVAAVAVALGTAIGRVGCFLFGCDFGALAPPWLPWAVRFSAGRPAWHEHVERWGLDRGAARSLAVHPTQLYEAGAAALIFLGLLRWRSRQPVPGRTFAAWAVCHGTARLVIEGWRGDAGRGVWGPLSTAQIVSLALVATGFWTWRMVSHVPEALDSSRKVV